MDISSELVHSLLPVFLVGSLGVSMLGVGLIEGVAEATALIAKVFSGAISDFLGRRKGLVLFGYALATLSKPLFPLATSAETVFAARFIDRIGKGIRGAPRDALIADVAPESIRGACFGLRQSMDTIGAFAGPLLAIALMLLLSGDLPLVFWFACIPAAIALLLIVFCVHEPHPAGAGTGFHTPIRRDALRQFSADYWRVVAIGALFALARFSEAFLVLRAQQQGLANAWIPLVMVIMSLLYLVSAYPVGWWSDRVGRTGLLCMGMALLIVADLTLAFADSVALVLLGVAVWGLHMGFSQGLLATLVADSAPEALKGTAFGVFNLVSGVAMLLASVLAGWLWQSFGAGTTFLVGAAFSALALVLLSRRSVGN
ncbi:MFS transporter [Pseudomonas sp. Milli4]|uniref:MFS transporter n=2 Tax=Pseudomonas schmalbachii TaxID=2816993 RepID=A0ABS3TPL9_9PSED|nr:MFS transporter [Pseudomonas schmalbachii]